MWGQINPLASHRQKKKKIFFLPNMRMRHLRTICECIFVEKCQGCYSHHNKVSERHLRMSSKGFVLMAISFLHSQRNGRRPSSGNSMCTHLWESKALENWDFVLDKSWNCFSPRQWSCSPSSFFFFFFSGRRVASVNLIWVDDDNLKWEYGKRYPRKKDGNLRAGKLSFWD
jgi:hypothetical protein